ncbi:MAG: hypothetical protein A2Z77_00925 [Chloroflexi bacterium RBG_13_51_36]|nr:MAG: hypothetical protein A2Z77_00925 [Chloroflexi bacterium RBG_13_51_36]
MVSPEPVAKRYDIAAESVQKETAPLFQRDCRAGATRPGAVDYMIVKQLGSGKWARWSKRWQRHGREADGKTTV